MSAGAMGRVEGRDEGERESNGSGNEARAPSLARALVVEDEAFVAFDMEDMLLEIGFREVVVCASYERAEEALGGEPFDLALFDLNLNGRLSIPLVERAHGMGMNVAVVSGYSSDRIALPTDAIPRIVKPCRPSDLRRIVDR